VTATTGRDVSLIQHQASGSACDEGGLLTSVGWAATRDALAVPSDSFSAYLFTEELVYLLHPQGLRQAITLSLIAEHRP
jgi:hypothetical protein